MSGGIFISYRRGDEAWAAHLVCACLEKAFPNVPLFMDVKSLQPGTEWAKEIDRRIENCDVLLALIGARWLRAVNDVGQRRLDRDDDVLCLEIASALKMGKLVIPVLLGNVQMPQPNELPSLLAPLAGRQKLRITEEAFNDDSKKLISVLQAYWAADALRAKMKVGLALAVISVALGLGAYVVIGNGPREPIAATATAGQAAQALEERRKVEATAGEKRPEAAESRKAAEDEAKRPFEDTRRQAEQDPRNGADAPTLAAAVAASKRGDYATVLQLMRPLAERGNVKAQFNLGILYQTGRAVPQDFSQAAAWFRKAADQGDATAQASLASFYEHGYGVPLDPRQAMAWYQKAADQGDTTAQINLGVMYGRGRGAPQDHGQAAAWYRKAAAQGHATAQANLAISYELGQGVPQDYGQAAVWYRKAADQGNVVGQVKLGDLYRRGRGVPHDYDQAMIWYKKAASQGDAGAQTRLGRMYDNGDGVPQDFGQAAAWYRKAADQGDTTAKNLLRLLEIMEGGPKGTDGRR